MRIIAFYLPQFHSFPENDNWWGKGFTEWTNVKKAKPLFKGHNQPRIPLHQNYYNLLEPGTLRWQTKLAREYGIYGFCYYHYWFEGHILMEKPMELMRNDKSITLPFCICWANEDWTMAWAHHEKKILMSQTYGSYEDWKKHFEYLLPFLQDKRYICIDGKPVFVIYRPERIPVLSEMISCWNEIAQENGLRGLTLLYQQSDYDHRYDKNGDLFDYAIEFQPGRVKISNSLPKRQLQAFTLPVITRKLKNLLVNYLKLPQTKSSTVWYDYDEAWERILSLMPLDQKMIPGAFVDWDNTPRYHRRASLYDGVTPEKFEYYLTRQIQHAKEDYHKDIIFMFAWNEWGEGGYLEPDEHFGYGMLQAVRNALIVQNEFPEYPLDT